jgi:ATP-dependent helicase/nuclease subunit A
MTESPKRAIPAATRERQDRASNPAHSAWVSANAGTGKTFVLARRVVRLLLADVAPERILCLTFTKAAAAEMQARVFAKLSEWVTAGDAKLRSSIAELLPHASTPDDLSRARRLFARALETPGGLKVQTIHAFAERLLQRFPLEAGIAPGSQILDEAAARALMRESIDQCLADAARASDGELRQALGRVVVHAAGERFDQILGHALALAAKTGLPRSAEGAVDWLRLDGELREAFDIAPGRDSEAVLIAAGQVIAEDLMEPLVAALRQAAKTDRENAETLAMARAASGTRRADALRPYFLTKDGEPRDRLATKTVYAAHPDFEPVLKRAQDRFVELHREAQALAVIEASLAIARLADAVGSAYRTVKAQRAALDYADLIDKAGGLLADSAAAPWVLFKLDEGLDHILVDEAQDTSPIQWEIVARLAEEFTAGAGAKEGNRTIFAVGDEKQSIYRFQGAEPRLFAEMGERFGASLQAAGQRLERVPLELSFRTVAPVLAAVDRVFSGGGPEGVASAAGAVHHEVLRLGEAGLVEIWETAKHEAAGDADPWAPDEERAAAEPPAVRLAERIATTIRAWRDRGEMLVSRGRPIQASDVLILVRKRVPFMATMIRALKTKGIPVAGADRIKIAEELAVMDLLVLGDVLLLPEDDLALATVLKSPLCGADDDQLFALAASRRGSLWQALLDAGASDPFWRPIAEELKHWRRQADYVPPFELLSAILDHDRGRGSGRTRFLRRLGAEALDPLDELLDMAMRFDEVQAPSLQGLLAHVRTGGTEIKRDMEQGGEAGRDEVRVMTVHGAKGLEAPIVFLPDTCSVANAGRAALISVACGKRDRRPVWPLKGTAKLGAIEAAKAAEALEDREEYHRLLYVAMTRARDRLYVAGFEGKNGRQAGCWYDLVTGQLEPMLAHITLPDGSTVRRLASSQSVPVPGAPVSRARPPAAKLPAWLKRPAPAEAAIAIPLAPSQLAPLDTEADGEPVPSPPAIADEPIARPATAGGDRFLRGELTHALLQHLPGVAPALRAATAEAFLARRGAALSPQTRGSIACEAMRVLSEPGFAALFLPGARAEVPIVAELVSPRGGAPVRLTGQIDRLAVTDREVLIVDYKTNRDVPASPEEVAEAYLLQLAAYRLALAEIYPGKPVRAALLWTALPQLMELPAALLDVAEGRLWELARGKA